MGKRKLHTTAFFQCDWTGYPMKTTNCFMPYWVDGDKATGKLSKKGSYCNWESVLAHATYLAEELKEDHTEQWLRDVREYVQEQTASTNVSLAPNFEDLSHFKGNMTMQQFHDACCIQVEAIPAVKISQAGDITEISLNPDEYGTITLSKHFTTPPPEEPIFFCSTRKSRAGNNKELTVYHYSVKNPHAPINQVATNRFKMQLHGDVILAHISKEPSFFPRKRYAPYYKSLFEEQFIRKKKRSHDVQALGTDEYDAMHTMMQNELNQVECTLTASSAIPSEVGKLLKMPPSCGRKIACKMKELRDMQVPLVEVH